MPDDFPKTHSKTAVVPKTLFLKRKLRLDSLYFSQNTLMLFEPRWRGIWGFAVLLIFLCGVAVDKIPPCGVAVISNPAVYDVCVFKPTVFCETKLFAVLQFLVSPLSELNLASISSFICAHLLKAGTIVFNL